MMDWTFPSLVAALFVLGLFAWIHSIGCERSYARGYEDGKRAQARMNAPLPMPGMQEMEPLQEPLYIQQAREAAGKDVQANG
jgi:hypothetical protein